MFTRRLRRLVCLKDESGVAAIELAFVLPLLLLILFGIINFGTVFYNYIVITNAAREAARWGSIYSDPLSGPTLCSGSATITTSTPNNPCEVANSRADGLLISFGNSQQTQTTATITDPTGTPTISVTVSFDFQGIGFLKTFFEDGLTTSSTMYMEPS